MTASARAASVVFGGAIFLVAAVPTALLLAALYAGAVGDAPRRGLGVMGGAVLALVALVAGRALLVGLRRAASDPDRTSVDAWVAAYVGTAVLVVGTFAIPVLMVVAMVNSDRAVGDSGAWFFVIWTAAHALVVAAALGAARLAFGGRATVPTSPDRSEPPAEAAAG